MLPRAQQILKGILDLSGKTIILKEKKMDWTTNLSRYKQKLIYIIIALCCFSGKFNLFAALTEKLLSIYSLKVYLFFQ